MIWLQKYNVHSFFELYENTCENYKCKLWLFSRTRVMKYVESALTPAHYFIYVLDMPATHCWCCCITYLCMWRYHWSARSIFNYASTNSFVNPLDWHLPSPVSPLLLFLPPSSPPSTVRATLCSQPSACAKVHAEDCPWSTLAQQLGPVRRNARQQWVWWSSFYAWDYRGGT